MPFILCQSCNGNIKVQFVPNDLAYYLHLTLSSVCNNEVGKWLIFIYQTFIASIDYFFHRSVVIRTFYCLDIEPFIVLFRGFHLLKYYACSNCISTRYVRVVKAFNLVG